MHFIAASDKNAIEFILSPGNSHDAPSGRALMAAVGSRSNIKDLSMDKGYEDDYTRYTAQTFIIQ